MKLIQSLLAEDVATKYPELRKALKVYLIDMVTHEVETEMEDDYDRDEGEGVPEFVLDQAWDNTVDETTNHILEIDDDDLLAAYEAAGGEAGVPSHDEYELVNGLKDEVIAAVRANF